MAKKICNNVVIYINSCVTICNINEYIILIYGIMNL